MEEADISYLISISPSTYMALLKQPKGHKKDYISTTQLEKVLLSWEFSKEVFEFHSKPCECKKICYPTRNDIPNTIKMTKL